MKMKIKYLATFIIATSIYFTGCVNSPTSPISGLGGKTGSIAIYSPVTSDSVGYDKTVINYSVSPVISNKSVELYVNGQYKSTYFTNLNDPSKALALVFDPSQIGTKISYYLKYYDSNGTAAYSDTMKNIIITEPRIKPSTPFAVRLLMLQGTSSNSVNISWRDNPQNEVYYEVWRRDGFVGDYIRQLGPLSPGTFNINDNNLLPNVVYYYKVRGQNKFGFSKFSDAVNTAGAGGTGEFPPPTGLKGVAVSSNIVKLIWQDNSNNENLFKVERNNNWSAWSKFETIATVASNVTTFTDNTGGMTGGHKYLYRIKAYSNSDSSWSNVASVKTPF